MSGEDLSVLQRRHLLHTARLIEHIYEAGYEATWGEGKRSDEQAEINALSAAERQRVALLLKAEFPSLAAAIAKSTSHGIRASVHRLGLAMDLNLFKDGSYCASKEDYQSFGEFWKGLDPLARWGGDFDDADHFSFEHNGVK